jgi:hypothetical protein
MAYLDISGELGGKNCTALHKYSSIGPAMNLSGRRHIALCPLILASLQLKYIQPIIYKIFLSSPYLIWIVYYTATMLYGDYQVRHIQPVPEFQYLLCLVGAEILMAVSMKSTIF